MRSVARTNASLIWFLLCALTIVSWALGTNHGSGDGHRLPASLVIFAVAIFKVRLVGLYFMELKMAPRLLRGLDMQAIWKRTGRVVDHGSRCHDVRPEHRT